MATSREITVWCDNCYEWTYGDGAPEPTVRGARAAARRIGWRYRNGKDLCPTCAII